MDTLFESLAIDFKEKAIGIILSGGGNDGLSGAKMIKHNGGKVLVQSPNSAESPGMPLSFRKPSLLTYKNNYLQL